MDTISASQCNALARKDMAMDIVVWETTIRGNIKPAGEGEIFSAGRMTG